MASGMQTFLQVLADRKALTEKECEDVISRISASDLPMGNGKADVIIKSINTKLRFMDLEIRGYHLPNKEKMVALINLVEDDVSKMEGSQLSPAEVEVFKKILDVISKGDDFTASSSELSDKLRSEAKMTAGLFGAFVQTLVDKRWLDKTGSEVSYGPRTYLELADQLRALNVTVPQMVVY
ncbi:hypothetical protein M885DRAFT_510851 [Pelagophyceae sp. CCMP2097]|nr:hypothetical protein M885DRAFT_510851 [Pelagophyceae sp. CCMP2097]